MRSDPTHRLRAFVLTAVAAISLGACSDLLTDPPRDPAFSTVAVTDLGTLGGSTSTAFAVGNDGRAVGVSRVKKKGNWVQHAFLWTSAAGMQDLTPTAESSGYAYSINANGTVVGETTANGTYRAFRRHQSGQFDLLQGLPGGYNGAGSAYGVNDLGQAVGHAYPGTGSTEWHHAVLWEPNGNIVDLGVLESIGPSIGCFPSGSVGRPYATAWDINNQGTVVGYAGRDCGGPYLAMKWTQATGMQLLPMPFGERSRAYAINDDGTIAGLILDSSGYTHAVIWTPANEVIDLGSLGGSFSEARGINKYGYVAGVSSLPSGERRAFVWDPATGTMLDVAGVSSYAYDISDNGAVAGVNHVVGRAQVWVGPWNLSIEEQIATLVDANPYALLNIPCDQIPAWVALANHTVPQSVATRLSTDPNLSNVFGTAWVQTIENARGPQLNLDYYAVTAPIASIPNGLSVAGYLDHIRTNINAFVDGPTFNYYPGLVGEDQRWQSDPLGTVFSIDLSPIADGSVVTTYYGSDHWTFTTIWTPADFFHPVSGHRTFGAIDNGNGTATFYTRGADRISTRLNSAADWIGFVNIYEEGGEVWESFQQHIASGLGSAPIDAPVTYRPKYDEIQAVLSKEKPVSSLNQCAAQ